jgi:hypothetical protein
MRRLKKEVEVPKEIVDKVEKSLGLKWWFEIKLNLS